MTNTTDPLDELDNQIIQNLRTDARRSNVDLAKQLGVSEGTVRNRVRRLISRGYMSVVAMTRLHKLGYDTDVLMQVTTEAGRQQEVAEQLSMLAATRYVAITTGAFDISVGAVFRNNRELYDFLTDDVAKISGITRTQTSHVLRTLKRVHDWIIYEPEEDDPQQRGFSSTAASK